MSAETPSGVADPRLASSSQAQVGVFSRNGDYWTIGLGTTRFPIKDFKGLGYIQRLLQNPGKEFHALDLLNYTVGGAPASDTLVGAEEALPKGLTVRRGLSGDSGEMLDAQSKRDYSRRIDELKEKLEDQRERGNHERADEIEEELEEEIKALTREMARGVGLGGRDRRAGSNAERARLNVTRAIKSALEKISEQQDVLGKFLNRSIRTGSFCSYVGPDPPIAWQFSAEGEAQTAGVSPEQDDGTRARRSVNFLRAFTQGTPFVGRDVELSILRQALGEAKSGAGKIVLIAGGPGVGKTRIAAEIAAEAAQRRMLTFVGGCYDREDHVPFIPFVEILEGALATSQDLAAFREVLGGDASEIARLAPQLRRAFPDIPPAEGVAEQSRLILFNAIAELVKRVSSSRPALFLLDDLQWADQGTLLLLSHLAPLVPSLPVMILGTYRDFELDLGGHLTGTLDELIRRHLVTSVRLEGLSPSAVAEMLRALSGQEPPPAIVKWFNSGTEGNPFFIEELFTHLVEQGKLLDLNGKFQRRLHIDDLDVPHALRLVIGRRLARLGEATLKVLGTAAVIGRSFTFDLLEMATQAGPDALLDRIEAGESAGLISSTLEYPEARFRFSHELIRKAVLGGLSPLRRQRLHLSIATSIERLHARALEDHADDLAHHLWNAGSLADPTKTVRYLAMAAKRALEQSAYEAATGHIHNALDLLKKQPDSVDRDRAELDLQVDYGAVLLATKGWYVAEAGNAYKRAHELCHRLGEDSRLFPVVCGLWSFHLVRGEHPNARSYAEELIRAPFAENEEMAVQSHWSLGCSQFFMGDFRGANDSFEWVLDHCALLGDRRLTPRFGQDPCVSSLCYDALALWTLGYAVQANRRAEEAISLARGLGQPFSLVWCLANLSLYCSVKHDYSKAMVHIEEGLRLAAEYGFTFYEELLFGYQSLGLAAQGKVAELRQASRRPRKTDEIGYELAQTWYRCAFAEALGNLGRLDRALNLIREAEDLMARNQERYVEPEVHRVKGELLLRQLETRDGPKILRDEAATVERSFLTAIELARKSGAKAYELRAARSLSQLLIRTGSRVEAQRVLTAAYERFTEGFDTPELKTAASLINEFTETS